jgi:2-keto-3-deoxy-L-rhamnonate aldolase RhmA/quercetin dioxygenase-like cupin family protein
MNFAAIARFRRRLAANEPVFGLWITLESPSIAEAAAALGLDWIVIDAEHGHLDWREITEHLRAAVRSETVALVRLAELNGGTIKRALDCGADGVVIPWVESSEQVRQAVEFCRYPPEGRRGIGAERATAWGQAFLEHTAAANEHVLVVPILETVSGVRQAAELATIDGVETFFFGPADLSASAGYRGQWEGPGVAQMILDAKAAIVAAGKNCGLLARDSADLLRRREQGFRMIGLGADAGILINGLRERLAVVGRDAAMRADLRAPASVASQAPSKPAAAPLARPPESLRPDRAEVMTGRGEHRLVTLAPGVTFDCSVGVVNSAKNLTTGYVSLEPGAELPYHEHPFTESVTVVEGRLTFDVEGRRYELGRFDNVTIPRGIPHAARNLSQEPVVAHIAMASAEPTRTLVERDYPLEKMPDDATGRSGAERVTKIGTAARGAAGPNTDFVDYFNADLMPELEMSGGYGGFEPGGRLPAHFHDFDESIAIVAGRAVCVVEGRRYATDDGTTALVPRGRVHYFINESNRRMEMIWVYAGPRPDRIVVDERCATPEGNPWQ